MGRHLLKAPNGVVVEWSSVTDAPVSAWRSPETLKRYLKQEALDEALRDYERTHGARIRRLEERGTSSFIGRADDSGWTSRVDFNRAGPGEKKLGERRLLALVTKMADECEASLASHFARDPVEVARREASADAYDRAAEIVRAVIDNGICKDEDYGRVVEAAEAIEKMAREARGR